MIECKGNFQQTVNHHFKFVAQAIKKTLNYFFNK